VNRWAKIARSFLILVFWVGFSLPVWAGPIEEIQKIEAEAGSLGVLLNSKPLLEDVFVQLQEYYGRENFPRYAFDAIVEQLQYAIVKIPSLEGRLWESNDLGKGFQIEALVASSGLVTQTTAWQNYVESWLGQLEQQGRQWLQISDINERNEKIEAVLNKVVSNLQEFGEAQAGKGLSKKQRAEESAHFFKDQLENPELMSVSAYKLRNYLLGQQNTLTMANADMIFDRLNEIREAPSRGLVQAIGLASFPTEAWFLMRKLIPDVAVLKTRTDLFKPAVFRSNEGHLVPAGSAKQATYVYRPLHRRWMGAFSGVFNDECIGGNHKPGDYKIAPSLERILVIALQNTQQLELQVNGRYQGFVRIVPVWAHGVLYGSIEWMARPLIRNVIAADPKSGLKTSDTLLSFTFKHLQSAKPKWMKGFVLGSVRHLNNSNALNVAQSSAMYVFGQDVGKAEYFEVLDPLAQEIPQIERASYLKSIFYTGNMVFDAKIAYQKNLTLLKDMPSHQIGIFLRDPKAIAEFFAITANETRLSGMVEMIAASGTRDPAIQAVLAKELAFSRPVVLDWQWWSQSYRETLHDAILRLQPTDPVALRPFLKALRENHVDYDFTKFKERKSFDLPQRIESILTTAMAGNPPAQLELAELLRDPHEVVRNRAFRILSRLYPLAPEVMIRVQALSKHKDANVQKAAKDTLAAVGKEASSDLISPRSFNQLVFAQTQNPQDLLNLGQFVLFQKQSEPSARVQNQMTRAAALMIKYTQSAEAVQADPNLVNRLKAMVSQMDPEIRLPAFALSQTEDGTNLRKASVLAAKEKSQLQEAASFRDLTNDIARRYLQDAPTQTKPTIVIVAAESNSMALEVHEELARGKWLPPNQFVMIDAANILEMIPEYQRLKKLNAELALQKMAPLANDVAQSLAQAAMQARKNVAFIPMTGGLARSEGLLEAYPKYQSVLINSGELTGPDLGSLRRLKSRINHEINLVRNERMSLVPGPTRRSAKPVLFCFKAQSKAR
jgi:hypothetical protein